VQYTSSRLLSKSKITRRQIELISNLDVSFLIFKNLWLDFREIVNMEYLGNNQNKIHLRLHNTSNFGGIRN
jgi:hypothetical protein